MSSATKQSLLQSLRVAPQVVTRVLRVPRILSIITGSVIVIGCVQAWPIYTRTADLIDRVPGAAGRYGRVLFDDLARNYPETNHVLGGGGLLAMALWIFFAGGVLTCVGRSSGPRRTVNNFLADSSRYFFRSFRTWLIFLIGVALWTWLAIGVLRPWLEGMLVDGGSEPGMRRFDIGVNIVWFLGFADLWVLRRLALARLVSDDRRSAWMAYGTAIRLYATHPIVIFAAFSSLFVLWALGMAVCGIALDRFVAGDRFVLGLLAGLIAVVWYQVCLTAAWVIARRLQPAPAS